MKDLTIKPAILAVLISVLSISAANGQNNRIWSDTPAGPFCSPIWECPYRQGHQLWENSAYPSGNGSIGLSVMSSPSAETIILNEKTLWTGGPQVTDDPGYYWKVNKTAHVHLPAIRKALLEGDLESARKMTGENFNGCASYETDAEKNFRFGHYTVAGELKIRTGIDGEVTDFERAVSLDSAYTKVRFRKDGHSWSRKTFVSYPDNVAVIRFDADTEQHLDISYTPGPCLEGRAYFKDNTLIWSGKLSDNGLKYSLRLKAIAGEADITFDDKGSVCIDGRGPIVLLLAMDTAYRMNFDPDFNDPETYIGENPDKNTCRWIRNAARLGYDRLYARHEEDYRSLFGRLSLTINPGSTDRSGIPTARRLEEYRKGAEDFALESLYLQYGRYLLISSSRAGNLPANLQGIWSDEADGPWHVDYHNNINVQMNYWPALNSNLAECAIPYMDYIRTLVKPGEATASAYYDAEGWTASISANIYGFTSPLSSHDMSWNLIPAAGPWLAIDVWNYFDYTRDLDFLEKTGYGLISGSARFVCGYLWKMPDGRYTAAPSTSPEHGPVDLGSSFVNAVCRELLTDAVKAAELLGKDEEDRESWKTIRDNIVPYERGRYGQLKEWSRDIDDPEDRHRHVNHLFGLHPGTEITPEKTPELAEGAKIVLNHRGDGATGWSMGWKLNQWARLQDGNRAYSLFRNLLDEGTYDNLWCAHPPFQIDGNFGGAAGLVELLVQSRDGEIGLLPALPEKWQDGTLTGAAARGGFIVSISWEDGKLQEAEIFSAKGGSCRVTCQGRTIELQTLAGRSYVLTPDDF